MGVVPVRYQRIFRVRPQNVQLYDVPETSQDSYNQTSTSGSPIGLFPMTVEPLKGQEQLNVRSVWATATHKVRCRWLGSAIPSTPSNPHGLILPRMYLVLVEGDGSQLNVVYAGNDQERNQFWDLVCEQKVLN